MTSKFKAIFSRGSTKARPDPDLKSSHTKELEDDRSGSIRSSQTDDTAEEKRRAWEARKEKEAEEWLWKQGFVRICLPYPVVFGNDMAIHTVNANEFVNFKGQILPPIRV